MNAMENNVKATERVPRMMRIREVAATGILAETALRQLYHNGMLPGIQMNKQFLVNYDALIDMLNTSTSQAKSKE